MAGHRAETRGWTPGEVAAVSGAVLFCVAVVCACAQRYAGWRPGVAIGVALFFPAFACVSWAFGFWFGRDYIDTSHQ